ncbi:MAG: nucleotidyltransferase [Spirochaetes bacterium GWF1_51_8]|nr:MAG: nucleotidyltransferase [Spirochaetes bacterium GWF1_51_8]
MEEQDIRWIQRFNNYCMALAQLTKFIAKKDLNELELMGLIQSFEYNYELAWTTIKDYFENQGEVDIRGSRDAFRLAFNRGLIKNGETWMEMIVSRGLTVHTYNQETADLITGKIINTYYQEFLDLRETFEIIRIKEGQ